MKFTTLLDSYFKLLNICSFENMSAYATCIVQVISPIVAKVLAIAIEFQIVSKNTTLAPYILGIKLLHAHYNIKGPASHFIHFSYFYVASSSSGLIFCL
jgi:hypothetical protein